MPDTPAEPPADPSPDAPRPDDAPDPASGDPASGDPAPTYPDAPTGLYVQWNSRRKTMGLAQDEALPPPDADLAALKTRLVADPDPLPPRPSAHAIKWHEVRREFAGQPELLALNALLIAHLRKKRAPRGTAALFHRLWQEEGPWLTAHLTPRWLVSSAITFGDHGQTEAQRRIGLSMNILFSLLKLYEYERLFSARPGTDPFARRQPQDRRLPLDLPGFSLKSGGLDVNLLAPIWRDTEKDPVAGPLAERLLVLLNEDSHGLFRRLSLMRQRRSRRRADQAAAEAQTEDAQAENTQAGPAPSGG